MNAIRVLASLLVCCCVVSPLAADDAVPLTTPEGYAVPQRGRTFVFPRDHGSHPEFAIEWWYITGHLQGSAPGERYGFQATFFRRALGGRAESRATTSASFGHQQVFLAHMALVNASTGVFLHQERLNRNGWDAAASEETLDVRNGNWFLRKLPARTAQEPERFALQGSIQGDASFQVVLEAAKPLVQFGLDGVSRKAAEPTAASHYLTFPRLKVTGTLRTGAKSQAVTGEAWMDHEFSSSQLGKGQVGWDWASIQLRDGRELMVYRMRRDDGTMDPFSTLAWVDAKGAVLHQKSGEFRWEELASWKSRTSGGSYPTRVRIHTTDPASGMPATYTLDPVAPDQELNGRVGGISYWEGACDVRDMAGDIVGRAYLELTGYSAPLQGKF